MATFTGQLKTNKVYASLYNMIISIDTFGTGVSNLEGIYSTRKVDGTLYGDTKLYVSTDVLRVYDANGGAGGFNTGYNLLTTKRPTAPEEEAIFMEVYKQIPLTLDDYLSKQAWADESSFSKFNGILLDWMGKTKEVYEHTKYTTDILITAGSRTKTTMTIEVPASYTGIYKAIYKGQEFARRIKDLMTEMKEPSRDYNDIKFLRNYSKEDFDIIVPIGILSGITAHDVPFLFNENGKPNFTEVHWKYFGTKNTTAGTTPANNTTIRALVEKEYDDEFYFAGDLLPNGTDYAANETYTATYTSKPDLLTATSIPVYLIHKKDFPIMSAFSVATSWFNPQALINQHYLTFGHNDVSKAHLGEFPLFNIEVTITDEDVE